ncbi:MAG TPA: DUF1761 domain-containing protein [Hyphomicrobium sp.]|nr:DUF1761 domain-containing protein [Hyphomicrobium sp.]
MEFADMNLLAVVTAAVVSFMFGWVWYAILFGDTWLDAIGRTREEPHADGPSPLPFIVSFIGLLVMACVLAGVLRHTSLETSPANGMITGAFMWLGFVITTITVNNAFRGAKAGLTLVDGGHWLGVLLLQGAVIGWFGA